MYVSLVRQQMLLFTKITRRRERVFKMTRRARIIVMCERLASKRKLRADVLAERRAFAAFPRLEISFVEQLHRFDVPSGLVE